jgi:hypothetical protein
VREGRGPRGTSEIAKALEVGRASLYRTLATDSDPEPADMSEIVVAQPNPHSPWEWEVYRNGGLFRLVCGKAISDRKGPQERRERWPFLSFSPLSREKIAALYLELYSYFRSRRFLRTPCAKPLIVAT